MSGFIRQHSTTSTFNTSDSWVILNPIEQSIKDKIERIGKPLKEWDVKIYRGILTGCNEAFIINAVKRNEILNNCNNADERKRTDELIRPILRGRDIKRYGYEWANLYIIATFPALRIDIKQYPAVEKHLLSFDKERLVKERMNHLAREPFLTHWCLARLEQTGQTFEINGTMVKSRKKTGNKWFETQDQIGYWGDFSKPKIVWAELARTGNAFAFDNGNFLIGNTGYILTMEAATEKFVDYEWLLAFLNSNAILFYLDTICNRFDETGWRWLRQHVELLPLPPAPHRQQQDFYEIKCGTLQKTITNRLQKINSLIAYTYGFNQKETIFLNNRFRH